MADAPQEKAAGVVTETSSTVLGVAFQGFVDALKVHKTLYFLVTLNAVGKKSLQCFLLNGVIFLGSIAFKAYVLLPILAFLGDILLPVADAGNGNGGESGNGNVAVQSTASVTFTVLWLVPMYVISFLLNTIWYMEIAEGVFKAQVKDKYPTPTISHVIRDEVYRVFLMLWMALLIFALNAVPSFFGFIPSFALCSWVYAFYCFDYKWTFQGLNLQTRMTLFERHWVYMLGFGAPCAVVTIAFPLFIGAGIYAMVFPLCVMLAIISAPCSHESSILPRRLPIFFIAQRLNLKAIRMLGLKEKEKGKGGEKADKDK